MSKYSVISTGDAVRIVLNDGARAVVESLVLSSLCSGAIAPFDNVVSALQSALSAAKADNARKGDAARLKKAIGDLGNFAQVFDHLVMCMGGYSALKASRAVWESAAKAADLEGIISDAFAAFAALSAPKAAPKAEKSDAEKASAHVAQMVKDFSAFVGLNPTQVAALAALRVAFAPPDVFAEFGTAVVPTRKRAVK